MSLEIGFSEMFCKYIYIYMSFVFQIQVSSRDECLSCRNIFVVFLFFFFLLFFFFVFFFLSPSVISSIEVSLTAVQMQDHLSVS